VWAVIERTTGELIGHCGLNHMPESTDIEVLYALARATWGRGLATEAAEAALAHGFGPVALPRIIAVTKPENVASRRVMERLGMAYEGERDAFGMHLACYALSRDGWRAARGEADH
jgi:ribosomal-protein-alanine N-acetyltransferase